MTGSELRDDETLQARTTELTDKFTGELTAYCDERVPAMLSNSEYAAACSALLISLSRQLGRTAAAFAVANQQEPQDVRTMVLRMVGTNFDRSLDAIGQNETVN
jgi:hypothetical protein